MSKWIECKKCQHKYQNSLSRCPNCSNPTPLTTKKCITFILYGLFALTVVVGLFLAFFGDKLKPEDTTNATSSMVNSKIKGAESSKQSVIESDSESVVSTPKPENSKTTSIVTNNEVVSSKTENIPIDDPDGVVKGSKAGNVTVTVPKWILFSLDPDYDYKTTTTDQSFGVIKTEKNANGSATFTFDTYNNYYKTVLLTVSTGNASCSSIRIKNASVTKVEHDEKFKTVKVYTTYQTESEIEQNVMADIIVAGFAVTNSQFFDHKNTLGSTFEIYNMQNQCIATSNFPKAGEEFYNAIQK